MKHGKSCSIMFLLYQTEFDADARYESVVAIGTARILQDIAEKENILNRIICKYAPDYNDYELSKSRINGTSVIQISILKLTGKYH